MFAGFDADGGPEFAFKCSEDDFDRLTAIPGIVPAPYAARFSWVKVERRGALTPADSRALLRAAYDIVRAGLPARLRAALEGAEHGRSS
jgi:predicted DNA-binding protein (MmcQ/YjbR family)